MPTGKLHIKNSQKLNMRVVFYLVCTYSALSMSAANSAEDHPRQDVAAPKLLEEKSISLAIRQDGLSECQGEFNPRCWRDLGVTEWLTNWYNTTPFCPPGRGVDTRFCRIQNEAWTTSFLRIAEGVFGGTGCTLLYQCLSYYDLNHRGNLDPLEVARYRYVRYNIYCQSAPP